VVEADNSKLAVYRDESGQVHCVSAVCTHMGCIVDWNNAEKSWDCPCHGSRFEISGEVIEGPALDPLKSKNPKE
jgi:Rieske Fe-S protein